MKPKELFEKIGANWRPKLLCFVAALLLFLARSFSHVDKRNFVVPVDVVSDGAVCVAGEVPRAVKLAVRSTPENFSDISEKDFTAKIDVTSFSRSGVYSVPITIGFSDKILSLDSVDTRAQPESARVALEEKAMRHVPLSPSISGDVAHGYEIAAVSVEPSSLRVVGPRPSVEAARSIATEKIDVSGISKPAEFTAGIDNINSLLQIDGEKCKVKVDVRALEMTRSFMDVPVKAMFLDGALEITSRAPSVSFDIDGAVPLLEGWTLDDGAAFVDCSSIKQPGSYDLPVKISLPSQFKVSLKSAESARVTVAAKKSEAAEITAEGAE